MVFFKATRHMDLPTKDLLSWIFDEIRYDPDKPVLIDAADPSRSISANQARDYIRKLIAGFRKAGLQPGDCVLIHSMNDIFYPLLVLGIIGAGGIFAGTNPAYTPYEMSHHIKTAKIKFLISEPEILPSLLSAAKENNIHLDKIWIFHPLPTQTCPSGYTSYTSLLTAGSSDWVRFNDLETCRNTICMRLFSSGTTGLPKAATSSHYNFIAQHELVFEDPQNQRDYVPINISPLPLFHAAIAPRIHTSAFKMKDGDAMYIMRKFDLEMYMQCIEKYQVTDLAVVPPIAIGLIMTPLNREISLRSVRFGTVGAAPLRPEPQARLAALLGEGAAMTQVWGMTETTCIATRFPYPERNTTGSVGTFLPNLDAKLADPVTGADISAYDTRGELCIRGPTVIPGYFENPAANAESFDEEGFFHTGDIAYCDGQTKLWYIVDRKKELIKVKGFQVAPPEIEGVLLGLEGVVDVGVIGVKGGEGTELPRAYVVRRPGPEGEKVTEEVVKRFVEERLAWFKRLEGGVRFLEAVPRNASGKILKRVLREMAEQEERQQGSKL
ncbi:amp dependent CoA ligase [Aulographum hederae CBS 113979]|uniref:Amp dependent CoA ligase n=1 Tax=Aulographum hederae CBS 113979 TaxID=1176131 RepID=A0A6G1HHB3_9PEZI|nr:amp dependent CoA ligase [Aulographum hederae CBS 113979]